jgi:hypothetical protein
VWDRCNGGGTAKGGGANGFTAATEGATVAPPLGRKNGLAGDIGGRVVAECSTSTESTFCSFGTRRPPSSDALLCLFFFFSRFACFNSASTSIPISRACRNNVALSMAASSSASSCCCSMGSMVRSQGGGVNPSTSVGGSNETTETTEGRMGEETASLSSSSSASSSAPTVCNNIQRYRSGNWS